MYEYCVKLRIIIHFHLQEWRDIEKMNEDNMKVRDEIETFRERYIALKKFAHEKKIILPPEFDSL